MRVIFSEQSRNVAKKIIEEHWDRSDDLFPLLVKYGKSIFKNPSENKFVLTIIGHDGELIVVENQAEIFNSINETEFLIKKAYP